jgi:hypothetical protein
VRDFSSIAALLHELTKKGIPFSWCTAQDEAFTILKDKLTNAPYYSYLISTRCLNLNAMLVVLGWVLCFFKRENQWLTLAKN